MEPEISYLWLDLETTGLDPAHDHILEVAAILTDDDFTEIECVHELVALPDGFLHWTEWTNAFVDNMHRKSGLFDDWNTALEAGKLSKTYAVEDNLIDLIFHCEKVVLAGSGVSHFDFRFLREHMPRLAEKLFWCPLDVGQIEEWLRVSSQTHMTFDAVTSGARERKTHRAMDDIRYHLDEGRYYKMLFKELMEHRV